MTKTIKISLMALALMVSNAVYADEYKIDDKGAHASIEFRIKHLGYSWLTGRFNTFDGNFTYSKKDMKTLVASVNIDPASVDSNHAERDKHLRGEDFLDVKAFPKSSFVSTSYHEIDENTGVLSGDLTLHGVTKSIDLNVQRVGEGNDPWGGYRAGFTGSTKFKLKDFNIVRDLGPASTEVEMTLNVEGIYEGN
ncbi:MAG: polyisoprenoid-binding protein YceI [Alphaproteobacteria bacterium]|jgi:polyisoprenoid-binding protein YceI